MPKGSFIREQLLYCTFYYFLNYLFCQEQIAQYVLIFYNDKKKKYIKFYLFCSPPECIVKESVIYKRMFIMILINYHIFLKTK